MSVSYGKLGSARAQYHLRQSFVYLNMFPINKPEVILSEAQQHIDENGKVTNVETRTVIKQLLEELIIRARKLNKKPKLTS